MGNEKSIIFGLFINNLILKTMFNPEKHPSATSILQLHCLFISFLFSPLFLFGQSTASAIKWGNVSEEERSMTVYEKDTSAAAVVLADLGAIMLDKNETGGYEAFLNRHCRVKIFNENGYGEADISLPFYHYEKAERIDNIRAQTISPDGTVTKLNKKDIFTERINDYWSAIKFALPDIQPGSVIEYSYRHSTNRIVSLFSWDFQKSIPVAYSELQVDLPGHMDYFMMAKGSSYLKIDSWKGFSEKHGLLNFERRMGKMAVENAPALKEEAFVTTIENYRVKIRFQLAAYYDYSGQRVDVVGDWDKLHGLVLGKEGLKDALNKQRGAKNFLAAAAGHVDPAMGEAEKMHALYQFTARHVKWNGMRSAYSDSAIDDIFAAGESSSGAVNICLLKLLREHGLEAHPVLTSSREHGDLLPLYPLLEQFNHLMVLCKAGGGEYILDAMNEYQPPGLPASSHLNKSGWVLYPQTHEWIEIQPKDSKDIFQITAEIDEQGALRAEVKTRYTHYAAIPERKAYREKGGIEAAWRGRLGGSYPAYSITEAVAQDAEDLSKPFSETFRLQIDNFADVNGASIFFNPLLFTQFAQNPFKSEQRYYPIEFSYPMGELLSVTIKIPENWELVSLPESTIITLDDQIAYQYKVDMMGNTIRLLHKLDVNDIYYEATDYEHVRKIFDLISRQARNQIVFKKKS
jgi:hypothetical protein